MVIAAAESDDEAAREAATEAREALRQAQEAEEKSVQDDAVISAIKAAAENAEEEGKAVAVEADDAEEKAELKIALVGYVTELNAQRTAIIDRFEVVLTELAAKGGDRTQYDVYIRRYPASRSTSRIQARHGQRSAAGCNRRKAAFAGR